MPGLHTVTTRASAPVAHPRMRCGVSDRARSMRMDVHGGEVQAAERYGNRTVAVDRWKPRSTDPNGGVTFAYSDGNGDLRRESHP